MNSAPDDEVVQILRDRYAFDTTTMKFVNQRDPRYNALFAEFISLVQNDVNKGIDIEDAMYRQIDTKLNRLGLDTDNNIDHDLLANFKADLHINIKELEDQMPDKDDTIHE